MKLKKIAVLGMLAAISIVGVALIHFSIFPQTPFLEYDPADIPIFIATFAFGTVPGLLLTIVVSFIQGVTVSSGSGIIGIAMHVLATGSFVLVSGLIYRKHKTRKRAYIALLCGVGVWIVTMLAWNWFITPIYTGMPREAVVDIMPFIAAFNLIKSGINSLVTALIYKRVHKEIQKFTD